MKKNSKYHNRFLDGDDEEISIVGKDGKAVFGPQPPTNPAGSSTNSKAQSSVDAELDTEIEQYKKLIRQEKMSQK